MKKTYADECLEIAEENVCVGNINLLGMQVTELARRLKRACEALRNYEESKYICQREKLADELEAQPGDSGKPEGDAG